MVEIFTDFDGTLTDGDSIVFLTRKFGCGEVHQNNLLSRYQRGEIDEFELIREELATVRISWSEAAQVLTRNISLDSSFFNFLSWCRSHCYPISVVSSGIQQVVSLFIGELGIPFFAHPVEVTDNGWLYQKNENCEKSSILRKARSRASIVYIGDGISDIRAVPYADVLFAKCRLAQYCREKSIPFFPFVSFQDVQEKLDNLIEEGVFEKI